MKNISIVGATGFVGRYLVASLLSQKEAKLRILIHQNNPKELMEKDNVIVIKGDLLCPETLDKLCVRDATVINLAYLRDHSRRENLIATNNLLDACIKAKIGSFIHCSTTSVFGRVSGDIVNENTKCNPINEYEITKMQIEQAVFERADNAFDAVILRPTAIFGPGGKNLLKLANDLRFGNNVGNYLKACLFNIRKMNLVCVHNVVAAIELLMQTEKEINREVFIVSDDEFNNNNYGYIERYLIKSLGLDDYSISVRPIPNFALKIILKLAGKSNFRPLCMYDCQKILNLGLKKAILFEDGLADFVNWYKDYIEVEKSAL